jgi:hypothetical protein
MKVTQPEGCGVPQNFTWSKTGLLIPSPISLTVEHYWRFAQVQNLTIPFARFVDYYRKRHNTYARTVPLQRKIGQFYKIGAILTKFRIYTKMDPSTAIGGDVELPLTRRKRRLSMES